MVELEPHSFSSVGGPQGCGSHAQRPIDFPAATPTPPAAPSSLFSNDSERFSSPPQIFSFAGEEMSDHVVERVRHEDVVNHGPSANRSRQCCLADGLAALAGTPRRATLRAYPRVSLCSVPAFARNVAALVDAAPGARLADQDRARAATARVGAIIRPRAEGYRHHALRDRIRFAAISVALMARAASARPDHASGTLRRAIVKKTTYDIIAHTIPIFGRLLSFEQQSPCLMEQRCAQFFSPLSRPVGALASGGMAVRQADAAMPSWLAAEHRCGPSANNLSANNRKCVRHERLRSRADAARGQAAKSGQRRPQPALEHDPEKWIPVFRKACPRARPEGACSIKDLECDNDSTCSRRALTATNNRRRKPRAETAARC